MWLTVLCVLAFGFSLLALAFALAAAHFARRSAGPVIALQQEQMAAEFTEQIRALRREHASLSNEWLDALEKMTTKQKQTQAAAARAARTAPDGAGPDGVSADDPQVDRNALRAHLVGQGRL